ncbi:hypothetical protein NsoK4_01070 [Nitrosopumilus sp. K4]|uniref:hypothetical protein n=1 Tax=Nitrosopumilus sp. K4 TaxID=2795383 RepID=UPI001BA7EB23|nr:hypothetical protein [Nitrosopumilus sp. K4]QUC64905.1 hypothetical protein NsoK4_01070 [Nitrosopumilus sp. K4]
MDKYLTVILIFMIVTIIIAFVDPATGEGRFIVPLFYGGIAGIALIVIYSSYKQRKERQRENAERKRKSKK